jgi:hypothetical protein
MQMPNRCRRSCSGSLVAVAPATAKDEPKLTSEDLVTRHVAVLGSPEALAAVTSRLAEGTASFRVAVGGSATVAGRLLFFSAGRQMRTKAGRHPDRHALRPGLWIWETEVQKARHNEVAAAGAHE